MCLSCPQFHKEVKLFVRLIFGTIRKIAFQQWNEKGGTKTLLGMTILYF